MRFSLISFREKRGIKLRGFEMGVVLGFCLIFGGRKRKAQKNVDQVWDGCEEARGRGACLLGLL